MDKSRNALPDVLDAAEQAGTAATGFVVGAGLARIAEAAMTPRRWTQDDTATLRRMASAGYSDAEIARHLGRDRRTVCDTRRRLGIQPGVPLSFRTALINHRRRAQIAA